MAGDSTVSPCFRSILVTNGSGAQIIQKTRGEQGGKRGSDSSYRIAEKSDVDINSLVL